MGTTSGRWYVDFADPLNGPDSRLSLTDITEFVIVLNNDDAVKAFSQGGNVTIGGQCASRRESVICGLRLVLQATSPLPPVQLEEELKSLQRFSILLLCSRTPDPKVRPFR